MKNLIKLLGLVVVFASTFSTMAQEEPLDKNYFQLSPRVGYDFPTYNNDTPYIDYKGGMELGLSLDYYWNWFGLGADVDYIKNQPRSTYPTSGLFESDWRTPIDSFDLSEERITRFFYGIGPNLQFRNKKGSFTAELNTRFGLASIKGGRTYLEGSSAVPNTYALNFHAGYNESQVLTAKGQLRLTYMLNNNWGIQAGAYYMRHFNVQELDDSGVAAMYQPFMTHSEDMDKPMTVLEKEPVFREPAKSDISSVGVFAGITYKFGKKASVQENVCPVCEEDHFPHCCDTCGCGITVRAMDKFTGEVLPNTDVLLSDLNGNVVQTGTTNSYGVVVFNEVMEDNYILKGKLFNVSLEEEGITKEEFKSCQKQSSGIQKVLLYGDTNFILKGNVVECNSDEGLPNVEILLKNNLQADEKHSLSDVDGDFKFHLKQASNYTLNGKKEGYYSNDVEILTSSYNRDNTLFIDFEMCVDPCGKAIKLDNINFDLDRAEILPEAIPDLQRIVKLMQDNPNIQVEMSSHTDSQGSDEYNRKLSQRRADATVAYIVNQGISKSRLSARGAGESELKNTKCANNVPCSDDEHRINRRTEFKVVCF